MRKFSKSVSCLLYFNFHFLLQVWKAVSPFNARWSDIPGWRLNRNSVVTTPWSLLKSSIIYMSNSIWNIPAPELLHWLLNQMVTWYEKKQGLIFFKRSLLIIPSGSLNVRSTFSVGKVIILSDPATTIADLFFCASGDPGSPILLYTGGNHFPKLLPK